MEINTFRKKWLRPLIFFEIYLSLTVALFFFGPWPWHVENKLLLTSYLFCSQLFIAFGYLLSWAQLKKAHNNYSHSMLKRRSVFGVKFLKLSLLFTFLFMIPTSLSRTGSILPNIIEGLSNGGQAYTVNFRRLEAGNPFVFIEYLRMLFSPFLVSVFPLSIVYWKQLSTITKVFALSAILFNLSLYLATGTNKGLADFVIVTPWLVFLGTSTGLLRLKIGKTWRLVIFVVFFLGFLQLFGDGQLSREGGVAEFATFSTGSGYIEAEKNNVISANLSKTQRIIYESVSRYVTSGYYALSRSFELEHGTTFGLGSSMFMARNANAVFSTTYFSSESLPGLLERNEGWGMFTLWHSIYPWLASDFGFVGALFIMGGFGFLLGRAWGRSILTADTTSIISSYLLIILFYYVPANNQIFQSGETFFAFFLVALWGLFRKISRNYQSGIRRERYS